MQLLTSTLSVHHSEQPMRLVPKKEHEQQLAEVLHEYKHIQEHHKLLSLQFETIFDYIRVCSSFVVSPVLYMSSIANCQ